MNKRLNNELEESQFEEFISKLLSSGDQTEILDKLGELEVPDPYRVRLKVLYSPSGFIDTFERISAVSNIKRIGELSHSYLYSTQVGTKRKRQLSIKFTILTPDISEKIGIILAISKREPWEKALLKFFKNNYPQVVPVYLSQSEMINSVKRLREEVNHSITVKSFSAKEPIESIKNKKRKSIREWTEESFSRILQEVRERNQMFTSIDLEFYPKIDEVTHVRPRAGCKIRKTAEVEISGNFTIIYDSIVKHIANVGLNKLRFFSGRGLRESSFKQRPLAINYHIDVFEEIERVRKFVSVMKKYPHSMYSVEHGNPYAHLKITDIKDGSSFNVYALPPKNIAVIPGLKASEAAFERIFHYIFDEFKEGDVVNYDDEGKSLESVIQ